MWFAFQDWLNTASLFAIAATIWVAMLAAAAAGVAMPALA